MKDNTYSLVNRYFARMKQYGQWLPVIALCTLMFAEPSYAGLQKGNATLNEIKTWMYSILGIGIFCYIMYHIVMALMNKGSWADVMMSVCYSALAGAALVLGDWAWSIWGS